MLAVQVSNPAGTADFQPPTKLGKSRRRVFFLVDSLAVGGSETQAVELARRLSRNHEVVLGCLRAEGPLRERLQNSPVKVVEFHPKGGIDSLHGAYQLLRLATFLRKGRFDVVHTHDLWSNLMGVPAAKLARVPVVISSQRDLSHLPWYSAKRRSWLRRIQRLSDIVVVNAEAIREQLIGADDLPAEKLRVIHNGVDVDMFAAVSRSRDGSSDRKKSVVLVGNMGSDVKGHRDLIAAAPTVIREFPDVHFVFVGDGTLREEFEAQVRELGIEESFAFLGRRGDVPEILASSDIGVLPSRAEGLPNALLEYMAAGLPVVVSNVGGNGEVVKDGVSGLLVPAGDPSRLADALLHYLRDPDFAHRLGNNGRERVRQEFSFESLVDRVEALYTEQLQQRGKVQA